MDYIVDEYVIACASVAYGASHEQEKIVKECLILNNLSEEQIRPHLNLYYQKYGSTIIKSYTNFATALQKVTGNPAYVKTAYFGTGLPFIGPYAAYKTYKEFIKNKDNHNFMKNTLQQDSFFQKTNSGIDPTWEEAILSYKNLSERVSDFNLKQKILFNNLSHTANTDLFIRLEARQNKRKATILNLNQILQTMLFDWPMRALCYKAQLEVMDAKGIIMDDGDKIMESGLFFSKFTKITGYTTDDNTRKLLVEIQKMYKKELSKKEYQELVSASKFMTIPFGLPPKTELLWQ